MPSLPSRKMTKRRIYLLLLLLGSSAQGERIVERPRKRRLGDFPLLRRALNIFSLDDEETEFAIRTRHDEDPEERNAFAAPTEPTPFPSLLPTIRPSAQPTVSPGDDTDMPTLSEGASNAPSSLPSWMPSILPSTSTQPSPQGQEPESQAPSVSPGDGTESQAPSVSPGDDTDAPTESDVSQTPSSGAEEPSASPRPSFGGGSTLESYLTETLTDDGSLATPGTPQNLAFEALAQSNPELNPNDEADQIQIKQRYALNTLFFSTVGDAWVNNNLWTSSEPLCGENAETSWHGVVCDLVGLQIVERLILPGNALFGTLPSEIRGLENLRKSSLAVFWLICLHSLVI